MNRIKSALILMGGIVVLIILSYSCCNKTYCESTGNVLYSITFNSFNTDETDTVWIVKYERNSSFSKVIDSTAYYSDNYYYYYSYVIYISEGLKVDYDYVIKTGYKSYKISDFLFKRFTCSSCMPFTLHRDYYYDLSSYAINGNKKYGNTVIIKRYDD